MMLIFQNVCDLGPWKVELGQSLSQRDTFPDMIVNIEGKKCLLLQTCYIVSW